MRVAITQSATIRRSITSLCLEIAKRLSLQLYVGTPRSLASRPGYAARRAAIEIRPRFFGTAALRKELERPQTGRSPSHYLNGFGSPISGTAELTAVWSVDNQCGFSRQDFSRLWFNRSIRSRASERPNPLAFGSATLASIAWLLDRIEVLGAE